MTAISGESTGARSRELQTLARSLAGQFEVIRELGRGGMGVVVLARDLRLDRMVAIKVLPAAVADDEWRERFLREARTAAQLSHPNIVPIYRADESDGLAFFVMGFVDGESLAERVQARGALPAVDVVPWLREVA
jgi:serine/threonine protein kinase